MIAKHWPLGDGSVPEMHLFEEKFLCWAPSYLYLLPHHYQRIIFYCCRQSLFQCNPCENTFEIVTTLSKHKSSSCVVVTKRLQCTIPENNQMLQSHLAFDKQCPLSGFQMRRGAISETNLLVSVLSKSTKVTTNIETAMHIQTSYLSKNYTSKFLKF